MIKEVSIRQTRPDNPLIAIDNEGGRVWRTAAFGTSPPSAAEISRAGDPQLASRLGYLTGRLLRQLGINFNLAPVLDLDDHPDHQNALRGRCWGNDTQQVIDLNNEGLSLVAKLEEISTVVGYESDTVELKHVRRPQGQSVFVTNAKEVENEVTPGRKVGTGDSQRDGFLQQILQRRGVRIDRLPRQIAAPFALDMSHQLA